MEERIRVGKDEWVADLNQEHGQELTIRVNRQLVGRAIAWQVNETGERTHTLVGDRLSPAGVGSWSSVCADPACRLDGKLFPTYARVTVRYDDGLVVRIRAQQDGPLTWVLLPWERFRDRPMEKT